MVDKPDRAPLPVVIPYQDLTPYELVSPEPGARKKTGRKSLPWGLIVTGLCFLIALTCHSILIYQSLGGWSGLTGPHPILKDDHPLYLHSAIVTKSFLRQTGTTAGYDPTFMGGYSKSAVFPASSTFPELIVAATAPIASAETSYKFYILISAILAPLIVAWSAAGLCHSSAVGFGAGIGWLIYLWTDFPIQYIGFGMIPYFLSIPVALATLRVCCDWLGSSRFMPWLGMTVLLSLTILIHFTALMVLGPAAFAAWGVSRNRLKHGLAGLSAFILAALANAFWWWPGVLLAATKGDSGFAFSHSQEGVLARLVKIPWSESPTEVFLWLGLLAGLPILMKLHKIEAAALAGFALGGFFWGYGAGAFPSLDFLQPGRHTYAFYLSGSVLTAFIVHHIMVFLKQSSRIAPIGLAIGICLVSIRIAGPTLQAVAKIWANPPSAPLQSSVPSLYTAIFNTLKSQVNQGDRVLYEEGGFGRDIFEGGRYSGVMARALGVEFIGGPYLHSSLSTNVAQFGEGKLFGREDWNLSWLEQMKTRYGLSWIVAWSDKARSMIDANPDQFQVVLNQGQLRVAKILAKSPISINLSPRTALVGQEHIEGEIKAIPGRISLKIKPSSSGIAVDREVVLRYHWVPNLHVIGHSGVRIAQENALDGTLPPLMKLVLDSGASGSVEIQLSPWRMDANGS